MKAIPARDFLTLEDMRALLAAEPLPSNHASWIPARDKLLNEVARLEEEVPSSTKGKI